MTYYIVGGGLGAFHMDSAGGQMVMSPLICREVTLVGKAKGNSINKSTIIDEGQHKRIRDKGLHDNLLECYKILEKKIKKGYDTSELGMLLDYMDKNHPEYLI